MLTKALVSILFGYLFGSIPTSVWIGRAFYGIDIRQHGSGNAGGTNMFRVLGWKPGLVVFVLDVNKGLVPVWLIGHWLAAYPYDFRLVLQLFAGFAAVLGHVWPILARFRGGKGIATLIGMLIVTSPQSVIVGVIVFLIVIYFTRYVSLSSMMAVLSFPCTLLVSRVWFHRIIPDSLLTSSAFAFSLVFFTHRSNIKRLLNGLESKLGRLAPPAPVARNDI